jgi:drug/metabolite transporter (DMT)-like permease
MSIAISFLVLLAALLHASWNAVLRAGVDRFWSMTIMCLATACVCAIVACFVPAPARVSWGCAVLSALFHVGYNLFLVRTYRTGDLGQTYPIARGTSPLLVALGAAVFASERPDPISLIGIMLVSGGIISLAFQGRKLGLGILPYALATGCFIGAYSITDGVGVRLSGAPIGYTIWMSLLGSLLTPAVFLIARRGRGLIRGRRETLSAAGGGIVSLVAYGIVIFAMSLGPMGPVSALRETSVVFAALIGWLFLKERMTPHRIIACCVIVAGALCIGHDGTHGTAHTSQFIPQPSRPVAYR